MQVQVQVDGVEEGSGVGFVGVEVRDSSAGRLQRSFVATHSAMYRHTDRLAGRRLDIITPAAADRAFVP
ncbi:hypothetical protein OIE75_00770 [Streptomyces sp. NBC_01723]|uniref:hypothetical protein n=1 Tax=Streptomyces sp. NBC_01723 TaxID=2975921 RepID=UPI002E2F0545|nr:hypothetical protein [Streptomyces sp. NBC_01723]